MATSKTTDAKTRKPTGDVVLQEMWRIKDTLSASCGHDVERLFAESRERSSTSKASKCTRRHYHRRLVPSTREPQYREPWEFPEQYL